MSHPALAGGGGLAHTWINPTSVHNLSLKSDVIVYPFGYLINYTREGLKKFWLNQVGNGHFGICWILKLFVFKLSLLLGL